MLEDLASRVNSLVAVHAMLSAGRWADLRLASLVERVAASSVSVRPGAAALRQGEARVRVTPSPVTVTAEQAHHLALVINELVTNAAKYGLGARGLEIEISIAQEGQHVRLTFRDRGPGYPPEVVQGGGRSVGLKLVESIVRLSLRGEWALYNEGGAITEVRFPTYKASDIEEGHETQA